MLIDNAVFRAQKFLHCFHVCGVNREIIYGAQTHPYCTPSSLLPLIVPHLPLMVHSYIIINIVFARGK